MHSAGHCTLILPFETSLDRWTDHAARTGKCGMPARSACRPSVPEFPLTLVIRGRVRGPRIPPASLIHGRVGIVRSALASRTFYAEARMSCGLQLFGFVIVSMWQMRAYPRTLHSCNNWLLPPI